MKNEVAATFLILCVFSSGVAFASSHPKSSVMSSSTLVAHVSEPDGKGGGTEGSSGGGRDPAGGPSGGSGSGSGGSGGSGGGSSGGGTGPKS